MDGQIKSFTLEFFKNLKCNITQNGDILIIEDVPKSFEDLYGKAAPYKISFSGKIEGTEFVGKGSQFLTAMTKYLEGAGKTTLLKIDFNVDPMKEIEKTLSLKNCKIDNLTKKHKNNFFSRFTFMTTFRYLNESEQVINEIYVHNGKIVNGDLSGYTILEGDSDESSSKNIEKDYSIARESLKDSLKDKTNKIGEILGSRLEKEIERIREHYKNLLGEMGGDLGGQLEKIKEAELQLRVAEGEELGVLRDRVDRLKKSLLKMGDDDAKSRVLKEQEFTIKDATHKHSLNIDNKLVNTTVIYYPVFSFNLFLKGDDSGRFVEMVYDPLTRDLKDLICESCSKKISRLNLCSAGHINCDDCLDRCGECSKYFCEKCLKRSCNSCGKSLCKSCSVMCLGCSKHTCKNHLRRDCVSGDDRCVLCLRACMRCHGMAQEKYFGEALDGSKVCQKCLGSEKRGTVMKDIFRD
jgi:hypothetical protein